MKKIRIAFVKFGGLAIGGTELRLQTMATHLPKDKFDIDYFYCDVAPSLRSSHKHGNTHPELVQRMLKCGIHLIKFHVKAKDITKPTHDWVDTDFWNLFDPKRYDLVQAGKAGPAEYPFHLMEIPVVELVELAVGVDHSPNIAWSFHSSPWQRTQWVQMGGRAERSSVIRNPAPRPATSDHWRQSLDIPSNHLIAGLIQRNDNTIFSSIPLEAFKRIQNLDRHFVVMNGGSLYRDQAKRLGLKNIHFIEQSADECVVDRFYNTLDIFAHGCKDGETHGTVFAEALMHGVPCLSHYSPGGANAQIEMMGPAGLFAQNLDDYAQKLDQLFSNSTMRQKMASKAKELAEEFYSVEAGMHKLESVYTQVSGHPKDNALVPTMDYGLWALGFLYAGETDNPAALAYNIATGGIPEEFELHVTRFFLPHIKTFYDVGANTGLYGFVAAHECPFDSHIYMYEPQPECCSQMKKIIWLNNWEDRVTVCPIGIGKEPGTMTLHLCGTGSTFNNAFNDNAVLPTIQVCVDTLDNQVLTQHAGSIDFIKIDVEGLEQLVLEGGQVVIDRDKPVIFIEIADHLRGKKFRNPLYRKTLEWVKQRDYQIFRCDESQKLVRAILMEERDHLSMYLCLHRQKHQKWISEIMPWANRFLWDKRLKRLRRALPKLRKAVRHPVEAIQRLPGKLIELARR